MSFPRWHTLDPKRVGGDLLVYALLVVVRACQLENYCYQVKSTFTDDKVKEKLDTDDIQTALKSITDAIQWLEQNQMADKEEFADKQKEVEGVCSPIIQKLNAAGGGGGSGMPGGMPDSNMGGGGGGGGPKIEEVD